MKTKKKLGTILLETGSVTLPQLREALTEQRVSYKILGEILMEKGILQEQQLREALGEQWNLPVLNMADYPFDAPAAAALPITLMERLGVFPLKTQDDGAELLVAAANPLEPSDEEELRAASNLRISLALAAEYDIRAALFDLRNGTSESNKTQPVQSPVTEPLDQRPFWDTVQRRYLDEKQAKQSRAAGIKQETQQAEELANRLKLPFMKLARYRPMPEAIKSVPRNVAERLMAIPLTVADDGMMLVAMADPMDVLAYDEIRMLTGHELKLAITTASEIKDNLDRLYDLHNNLEDAIVEVKETTAADTSAEISVNDAPVIQLVNNLLNQAVREEASDIHVEPCKHNARIRYRVDGVLYTAFEYPSMLHPAVSARLKIMSGIDIAEKRKPQDGRCLIQTAGRSVDLRVNSVPTTRGEKVVLRILDQENAVVGLENLGMESDDLEKISTFCKTPWGILLATGPTGSGKSTTLYSILEILNQPGVNIITVEDPVEYSLDGISQIHVNEKAGLSFASALRSILRQDPDKIMVGEIRDQETAQIAIRAALTGHFVLSTLHTNDAPSALTRMVDMGVPPFLVAASLTGVIAQRLVRKLCPVCREEYELDSYTCEALNIPRGSKAWRAVGCDECRQGYRGRLGIYEIMLIDDDLRKMILAGADSLQIRDAALKKGMKTLRQSGINCALRGQTSVEEVLATAGI